MIALAVIGLLAAGIEVRVGETEGVDRVDLEAIVQEAIASLKRGGHEVCFRAGSDQASLRLPDEVSCGALTTSDVVEISCFGAVSRARVLFVRTSATGAKLGEAEADLAKDDPTPLRSALTRLIPPAPTLVVPSPPPPKVEEPTWPVAVGIGGLVFGTAGACFLAGAFATDARIGGPGTDPIELESIESHKHVLTVIGGGLLSIGLGALVTYALVTSD